MFVTPSSWHNTDLNPVVFALTSPRRRSIWSGATTESNTIARADDGGLVSGGGLDGVVVAVLVVVEKGITHIPARQQRCRAGPSQARGTESPITPPLTTPPPPDGITPILWHG